jgi:hypothetical protein
LEASYRLVDYLEQFGRRTRSQIWPPDAFWLAALRDEAASGDIAALARAAYNRDRTEIAHRLAQATAARGAASGISAFATLVEQDQGREAALPYFRLAFYSVTCVLFCAAPDVRFWEPSGSCAGSLC